RLGAAARRRRSEARRGAVEDRSLRAPGSGDLPGQHGAGGRRRRGRRGARAGGQEDEPPPAVPVRALRAVARDRPHRQGLHHRLRDVVHLHVPHPGRAVRVLAAPDHHPAGAAADGAVRASLAGDAGAVSGHLHHAGRAGAVRRGEEKLHPADRPHQPAARRGVLAARRHPARQPRSSAPHLDDHHGLRGRHVAAAHGQGDRRRVQPRHRRPGRGRPDPLAAAHAAGDAGRLLAVRRPGQLGRPGPGAARVPRPDRRRDRRRRGHAQARAGGRSQQWTAQRAARARGPAVRRALTLGALAAALALAPALARAQAAAGPPRGLTMLEALAMAKRANKSIVVARAQLAAAHTNIEQAWAALFPVVSAHGKYTRNYKNAVLDFGAILSAYALKNPTGPAPPDPQTTILKGNQLDGDLNANMPLIAPAAYPALDSVKKGYAASEATYETNEDDVLYSTAQTFYAE